MNFAATGPPDLPVDCVCAPSPRARATDLVSGEERAALRAAPIGQCRASAEATARPERATTRAVLSNLPESPTGFIGREREIREIRQLLGATRLLTLAGTGGVGKTRLAYAVAASIEPQACSPRLRSTVAHDVYPDGIWLVELAALEDPTLVPQAIASVLGVPEDAARPPTAVLIAELRTKAMLLILDNCEHLIEACGALADTLLRRCPGVRLLATSRQPLGIAGEATFQVPPLSVAARPPSSPICPCGPAEPPIPSEAARLFVERARAALSTFRLTDRNAVAVEQICRRLDGLPLAIELAAARVAVLSPEQIEARLGNRFHLLSGGSRTVLPRYRTLRALIDWSYDLLDEREQLLLRRLAVFAGGWTLEAAEAVCAGDGLAPDDILDLLSGLVGKSLVLAGEQLDEVRYRFLESPREYAAEKLRDAGEETLLRDRHRDWFLALAERIEPELLGPRSVSWMDRLEYERGNIRAALGWCLGRHDPETGLRLAGALGRFWLVRGPYRETRAVMAELLAVPTGEQHLATSDSARTKALLVAGRLAMRQDDRDAAERQFQEVLETSRQRGDQRSLASALAALGHVARVRGDYLTARSRHAEAIRVFEELGDDFWLARAHHYLGVAAYYQGDLATASEQYELSLVLSRRLGDEQGILTELEELGEVSLVRGEHPEARSHLQAALELACKIDDKERICMALAALAGLAAAQDRPEPALQLMAAAMSLIEATDQRNSPAWYAQMEQWLEPARRTLGPEACSVASATGRALPLDAAVALALGADEPVTADHAGGGPAPTAPCSSCEPAPPELLGQAAPIDELPPGLSLRSQAMTLLTRRELEVAMLVARGLTNRQIAAELVIAEGTATNHVKSILARLGLDSRVQIAAWVLEHGLHRLASS